MRLLCYLILTATAFWHTQAREAAILQNITIDMKVTNLMATTLVTGFIKNFGDVVIEVLVPPGALIQDFHVVAADRTYTSRITVKENHRDKTPKQATSHQISGRFTESNIKEYKNFNIFILEMRIPNAHQMPSFRLTYGQMLQRRHQKYEIVADMFRVNQVENIDFRITIKDFRPLSFVRANPSMPNAVKINFSFDKRTAFVKISSMRQKQPLPVIEFDVERNCSDSRFPYLKQGTYFCAYFSPCHLESIEKEIVFVLDTSGSMGGLKINQLKSAMDAILSQVESHDRVALIQFSDRHTVFTANGEIESRGQNIDLGGPATPENIEKLKAIVNGFNAYGGTDLWNPLSTALDIAGQFKAQERSKEAMVIFLTDGQPSCGFNTNNCRSDTKEILQRVYTENSNGWKIPIYTISFGDDADKSFLQMMSAQNRGFHRHIDVSQNTHTQLAGFFEEISKVLLADATFSHSNGKEMTKTKFPVYFDGYEYSVCGKLNQNHHLMTYAANPRPRRSLSDDIPVKFTARGKSGLMTFMPITVEGPDMVGNLSETWAFSSLKQLMDARDVSTNESMREELDIASANIATRYHYFTPVTDMVFDGPDGAQYLEAFNLTKVGKSLGYSVNADDLDLEDLATDDFSDDFSAKATQQHPQSVLLLSNMALFAFYYCY